MGFSEAEFLDATPVTYPVSCKIPPPLSGHGFAEDCRQRTLPIWQRSFVYNQHMIPRQRDIGFLLHCMICPSTKSFPVVQNDHSYFPTSKLVASLTARFQSMIMHFKSIDKNPI